MTPNLEQLDKAHGTLMLLQESQNNIGIYLKLANISI